jgi:3-hydroxyacyl-CoA dehydrogenase
VPALRPIRRVAVLGAGTMGAQIAAHLANVDLDVRLFDVREDLAAAAVKHLTAIRPDPLFQPEMAARIRTGSLDRLAPLAEADWIIEAVLEDPGVKGQLLAGVDAHRAAGSVISTNTSGLSIAALSEGRSDDFRRHWVGTHFFNPPRYMHLVELVPTPATAPEVVEALRAVLERRLGKGVVVAKDTPAFIANRLGMHGVMQLLAEVGSGAFTLEEIDAITGPLIGRPKSATFRTIDLAGLDILAAVARDLATRLPDPDDRRTFLLPPFVEEMLRRGLVGEKAGQGFYKRLKTGGAGPDGGSTILRLDLETFEYRELRPVRLPELDAVKRVDDLDERLRRLFAGADRTGDLLRRAVGSSLDYAAHRALTIAESPDDIDRAMRWGYGWERGPLELLAITRPSPTAADPPSRMSPGPSTRPAVVARNAGASLLDLGDGVLAVEFHSKLNTVGGDTIAMIRAGIDRATADFAALVIAHDRDPFSAGANLALLLIEAQDGNWDEVDAMVRAFQAATSAMKFAAVPVLTAPAGLAIGGGCEICLHADRVQASAETYMGLVEVGVGLIPAGGGTKEMLLRAEARAAGGDLDTVVRETFETIGLARVSTSAAEARRLGYLRAVDGVTMNRDRLRADAKARALARVAEGYAPPLPRTAIPVGGADVFAILTLGVHLAHRAGRLSDHDVTIGRALARILAGGDLPHRTTVSEAYLLDLEREAFLSLCGEPKTLARIAHTLKTGKPLRN